MATKDHCYYCFSVLESHLTGKDAPTPTFETQELGGIFVTWKIKSGKEWDLRGCIGNLASVDMNTALKQYALISALRDHRFPPIDSAELPSLQCGVSFLINFTDNKKHNDWVVGKHGIIIAFEANGSSYNATYLPEVAEEQGWNVDQAIESLVRKAGYRGAINAKLLDSISLTTYESSKVSMTYDEYVAASK